MATKSPKTITVNGLEIQVGKTYKITGKVDPTSPKGLQDIGTSKIPNNRVANSTTCPFKTMDWSSGSGIYDTGFYVESPCYADMDIVEVKTIVRTLNDMLVNPYERRHGKGILDHNNFEFWDNYRTDLREGRMLATRNVDDLMALYIAMRGFDLTPEDQVKSPKFSGSQYCVIDRDKSRSIQEKRSESYMDTIIDFGAMLNTDKNTLIKVLHYLDLTGVSEEIDNTTLKTTFKDWVEIGENVTRFRAALELMESETDSNIIPTYVKVRSLMKKGIVKIVRGEYYFESVHIGVDLQSAARFLNRKENEELLIKIMQK